MSYTAETTRQFFAGNGATTVFAYAQDTAVDGNVHVSIIDAAGLEIVLTNVTHFDLGGVGEPGIGFNVTYPRASVAPIAPFDVVLNGSEKLVVWVEPPSDQQFEQKNADAYSAAVIEQKFDEQMRIIQRLKEDMDRAYKVSLGSPNPAPGGVPDAAIGNRILLATATGANVAKLTVQSINWSISYDTIELDFIGIVGISPAAMEIQPIDNGSATTTNLEANLDTHIGSRFAGSDEALWTTSLTYTLGITADDWLTGMARFTHYNSGYLNGQGSYNWRSAAVHTSAICTYARHTTAMTRLDGMDVLMSTGNISGTVNMYGIRKS